VARDFDGLVDDREIEIDRDVRDGLDEGIDRHLGRKVEACEIAGLDAEFHKSLERGEVHIGAILGETGDHGVVIGIKR